MNKKRLDELYSRLSSFPSPFSVGYKEAETDFQMALAEYKKIPIVTAEELGILFDDEGNAHYGGEDIRSHPVESGLYRVRVANHPQENADVQKG